MKMSQGRLVFLLSVCVAFLSQFFLPPRATAETVKLEELSLDVPNGWNIHQRAEVDDTKFLGIAGEKNYLTLYAKKKTDVDIKKIFVNDSKIERDITPGTFNGLTWLLLITSKEKVVDDDSDSGNDENGDVDNDSGNDGGDDDSSGDDSYKKTPSKNVLHRIKKASEKIYIVSFLMRKNAFTYYGYTSAKDISSAEKNAKIFLNVIK